MENLNFRYANEKDAGLILEFIRELAKYENMIDEVIAAEPMDEWTTYRIAGETLEKHAGE